VNITKFKTMSKRIDKKFFWQDVIDDDIDSIYIQVYNINYLKYCYDYFVDHALIVITIYYINSTNSIAKL